jgi:hypothetical protein
VGVLNKYAMIFWALALLAALLATRARRTLASPWFLAGAAIAILLVLPNAAWQLRRGLPMLELLRHQAEKNVPFTWATYLGELVKQQNPLMLPLWLGGLGWLLAGRGPGRPWLGLAFAIAIVVLGLLGAKPYYVFPAFPVVFAAGGCATERVVRGAVGRTAIVAALALAGTLAAPLALPILAPARLVAYARATGIREAPRERVDVGARLPQQFADQLGWPDLVESVARAWRALPPDLRARTAILAQNSGEAGAIDLYGPALGLPPATSPHNSYWYWGPPPDDTAALVILDFDPDVHRPHCGRLERVGQTPDSAWNMPYERRRPIWLCTGLARPPRDWWPALRLIF